VRLKGYKMEEKVAILANTIQYGEMSEKYNKEGRS
jgi:hypothetical protein